MNFQMFKLVLEKAEEPEIMLPTSAGSSKNQEFQKNIYFCFIDYANLHRTGSGGGEEPKLSRVKGGASLLFVSFGSACPHTSRMYFPLLVNKTEL